MAKSKIFRAILFVIACELLGSAGTVATAPAIRTWYPLINKPAFNPPNWIFGPVWIILFALIGYSAFLIYEKGLKKRSVKKALTLFAVQFILNILWSFIFFGAQMFFTAFIELVLLWIFILLTASEFYRINKIAGLLLLPYIFWVAFAGVLNLAVAILN